ncbi:DNA adenine methylase (plasmid) [Deinococcus sp. PESE-38]
MGSKHQVLPFLYQHLAPLEFRSVTDAFSGSGAVSYLLKGMGKAVTANDFMHFSYQTARAIIDNAGTVLTPEEVEELLRPNRRAGDFIQQTFRDLYFTDEENALLDTISHNIRTRLRNSYKRSIAYAALARACLRKRPRGLFTYTGVRYLDGRRDLQLTLADQFREAVNVLNRAVYDNGQENNALNMDAFELPTGTDLVYLDPPYVSGLSDNDYIRRYHFVEGLVRYWEDVEIQEHTSTKKFARYPSLFDSKTTVRHAFSTIFDHFRDSIITVSYSSNGIPSRDEMVSLLQQYKENVVVHEIDHLYSFGTHAHMVGENQNRVQEYLFIGS